MTTARPPGDAGVLDGIVRSITSSLDLDVVLPRIADAARQLCGSDTASLFLRDAQTDVMVPRFRVGSFPAGYDGVRVERGQGLGGVAWETRRPVRTAQYAADPNISRDFEPVARQVGAVAVMAVPILIGETVEGLLYVGNHTPRPFTDDDEALCVWLAHQAAIAVQNASLFIRERQLRTEAEILATLASQVTASLELDRVLQTLAEAVHDLIDADVVRIALRDADGAMRYRYLVGTRAKGYDHLVLEPGRGFVGRTLETGRPFRTDNAPADARVHPEYGRYFIETEAVKTAMVVPVHGEQTITGLVYTARRGDRPFSDEDERLVSRLAEYASLALRNAESFRREQTARAEAEATERRVSFLAQASTLLSASLDVDATLKSVARLAVPFLADFCAVDMMVDDQRRVRRVVAVHADPTRESLVREVRDRHGFKPTGEEGVPSVLATGRTAYVPHVTDEHLRAAATSEEQLRLLRELHMRSWIIVPLVARGRVLGAITLVMAESERRYGATDVATAEDLGRRAAIAIDNAQLYREAQLANHAKDQFLATVSHELRTPINAVYGWARMMRSARLDATMQARALEAIERNAHAQVQLIDDLLDMSRIVNGKLRLDVRPVDVAAVIDAALDTVRPAADAKGVRLQSVIDPRATPIMGDPDRLQQVVWNLLVNAVKFTPRGGRVQTTLRRVDSHVEILVTDTGVGIDPAFMPHLFERFRQGDRQQGGLGIGLALVRHIVELHGGTVSATSPGTGEGATFTVEIPLAAAASASTPSMQSVVFETPATTSLQGLDVLVVDDDADTRELLLTILSAAGGRVRTAASASAALQAIDARMPMVVISDIEMPEEDGYTLVRRIRERPREAGGAVPVIALTAYSGLQARIRVLDAGFDMHIPKPVDPLELTAVLGRLARRA